MVITYQKQVYLTSIITYGINVVNIYRFCRGSTICTKCPNGTSTVQRGSFSDVCLRKHNLIWGLEKLLYNVKLSALSRII